MTTINITQQEAPIKPAFSLSKLEEPITRTVRMFDKKTRRIETEEIEEEAGYLLTTMKGNSVRIKDIAELEQYGLGDTIPIVNEQLGETVGVQPLSIMNATATPKEKG